MAVTFDTVPSNAIASFTFVEQKYRRSGNAATPNIPQRIALLGQYIAAKTPVNNVAVPVTTADEVAALAGYGSQAHMMALKLFNAMGQSPALVDWYPIADGTTAQVTTVTFAGAAGVQGLWRLYIVGKRYEISVLAADTAIASATAMTNLINADLSCPFGAANGGTAVVTLTAKWKGLSSSLLDVRKNYYASDVNLIPTTQTMVIASSVTGATDPSLATALANFGDVAYTWVITGQNDATTAAALETAGEARWDPSVKKPWLSVMGYVDTRSNFVTALGSRNSKVTVYMPVEASPNHPGEIAAATVGAAAVSANADPYRPFKNLVLTGILPGSGAQWTRAQADAVEAAGGSAFRVSNAGAVSIWDLLTTYKTNSGGAADDSFRYAVTVTNIQNKIYSLDLKFSSDPYDRAIVISDDDVSGKAYTVSPKSIKADAISLVDQWVLANGSKNRDQIVAGIVSEVDSGNPGRINLLIPDIITVGLRIVAVRYQWSTSA